MSLLLGNGSHRMNADAVGRKIQAYGLLELMFATAAASLLFILLMQLFMQLTQSTFFLEKQALRNDVVYFALTELKRDIRMSRYLPCGSTAIQVSLLDEVNWWHNPFINQLRGYDAKKLPKAIANDALEGNDALMILRAGGNRQSIKSFESHRFTLSANSDLSWLRKGALLIACDSKHTLLFKAGEVSHKDLTIDMSVHARQRLDKCNEGLDPLNNDLAEDTQCLEASFAQHSPSYITDYYAVIYYVSKAVSAASNAIYREQLTLSKKEGRVSSRRHELNPGVNRVDFKYQLDINQDGYAETQLTAGEIKRQQLAWSSVSAVDILLHYPIADESDMPLKMSENSDHSRIAIR